MEVRAEVGERVGRLVRFTNVVKEDGDRRPLHREVTSTIGKGTAHEWHKIAERVAELFLEQVFGKSERAKGTSQSKDQKREGKVLEVHKRDCVWPLEGSNVGTRSGGADDVASASSTSSVVCCCLESLVFL